MKIFAISDLHLSFGANKPMEVFGGQWSGYLDKIVEDWNKKVEPCDVVLIAGDISWAMKIEETVEDFNFLKSLSGTKIITRGNHDYWWASISAVRSVLPENTFALQNDAIKLGNFIFCGSRGWPVPETEFEDEHDEKIFNREILRLEMSLSAAKRLQTDGEKIICMVHFPPFNSLRADNAFTKLFEKYEVSKVVYGHLHGTKVRANLLLIKNNVEYFLTSCDQVENQLVLIDEME